MQSFFNVSDDDDIDIEKEERKVRLIGRMVMFLLINGPTTLLTLGLWIRVGTNSSAHTGSSSWLKMALIVWLVGLVGSAFAIFKK